MPQETFRGYEYGIVVVEDWGHASGDNRRLETYCMRLLEINAITGQ